MYGVPDGAFPCRGCGLFPAAHWSIPVLAKSRAARAEAARTATSPCHKSVDGDLASSARGAGGEPEKPIESEEVLGPRRKAFAKLDANANGSLSFEEWAVKSIDKFKGADRDRSGWLTAAEYATTAPPPPKKKQCSC
jgi:hypothetical protein